MPSQGPNFGNISPPYLKCLHLKKTKWIGWGGIFESTIEIAKVSKLLIAVDNGQTSKWAGKSLGEISIDGKNLKAMVMSFKVKVYIF